MQLEFQWYKDAISNLILVWYWQNSSNVNCLNWFQIQFYAIYNNHSSIFYIFSPILNQGCAKTRVFYQKPSPVGLTGLNRVLMGFMGKTGENSNSLCRIRIKEPNLENLNIILQKWASEVLYHQIFPLGSKFWQFLGYNFLMIIEKIWLQLKKRREKLIKPNFPHFGGFFCVV